MRKISYNFLLLIATAMIVSAASAQTGYYVLSMLDNPGNPNGIITIADNSGGGWTTLIPSGTSNPTYSTVRTLPFAFKFNGSAVTQFKAASTGYITFDVSATAAADNANEALPSAKLPDKSVCVWGLQPSGSNDLVRMKVWGMAPARQLSIQYFSCSTPGNANSYNYYSIVLEETTNRIYLVEQYCGNNNGTFVSPGYTLGIQIDGSTAVQIAGSPNYDPAPNAATNEDNNYYEFAPGVQMDFDVEAKSLVVPKLAGAGEAYDISGSLMNRGLQTITSMDLNYQADNGPVQTQNLTGLNIASKERFEFLHSTPWITPMTPGVTPVVKIWASNINGNADQFNADDTLRKPVMIPLGAVQGLIMIEEATNSDCGPCATQNPAFDATLADYSDKVSVIKYHAWWPGPNDPMYLANTTENAARIQYYGMDGIGVPCATINGRLTEGSSYTGAPANISNNPSLLDDEYAKAAYFDLNITSNFVGNTLNVNAEIVSQVQSSENTWRLHIGIIEEHIDYGNPPGTNGESEFFHVMRKMLPDETGTAVGPLEINTPKTFNLSYTFDPSEVDPTQLRAAVFMQDDADKQVFQAAYHNPQVANAVNSKPVQGELNIFPSPVTDRMNIRFDAENAVPAVVRIQNALGQTVKEVNTELRAGYNMLTIETSDLEAGVYFVIFDHNSTTLTKKFSVIR